MIRTMKVGGIIQARMSSKRFPGKVLYPICGKPMLGYLVERLCHSRLLDIVVVATSLDPSDDPIVYFCKKTGVECHRGPLHDVAGRFKEVIIKLGLDGFLRSTADSPLLDQWLIDKAVEIFRAGTFEIVTNVLERTYPAGQSVEVLKSDIFIKGYGSMSRLDDFEHVTKFFYDNHDDYKIYNIHSGKDHSGIQLSVDTAPDMDTVTYIISRMKKPHWEYRMEEILNMAEGYKIEKERSGRHGKGSDI
ncbi:MAG: hypothetical protein WC515_07755 [Candidatus Omnitrophota bacterium]